MLLPRLNSLRDDADKTYATAYTYDFQIDVSAQLGGANGHGLGPAESPGKH